jgi:predicted protein tyrosine phosphatase
MSIKPKIEIMPIDSLLRVNHLYSTLSNSIIFLSTRPNYYNFGCTPFLHLQIPDTTFLEDPSAGITDEQISDLLVFLDTELVGINTLYVCCDAGLSRSPAVALFISNYIGDTPQSKIIDSQ